MAPKQPERDGAKPPSLEQTTTSKDDVPEDIKVESAEEAITLSSSEKEGGRERPCLPRACKAATLKRKRQDSTSSSEEARAYKRRMARDGSVSSGYTSDYAGSKGESESTNDSASPEDIAKDYVELTETEKS